MGKEIIICRISYDKGNLNIDYCLPKHINPFGVGRKKITNLSAEADNVKPAYMLLAGRHSTNNDQ